MSETENAAEPENRLEFTADLDEAPEKVWRAITEPDLLARWIPELAPANENGPAISAEPIFTEEGEEVHYRWHDLGLPEFDTFVIFDLSAREDGGSRLRIIHELRPVETKPVELKAANSDRIPVTMLAA